MRSTNMTVGTIIIGEIIYVINQKKKKSYPEGQLFPSMLTTLFSGALKKQMSKTCEQKETLPIYYL